MQADVRAADYLSAFRSSMRLYETQCLNILSLVDEYRLRFLKSFDDIEFLLFSWFVEQEVFFASSSGIWQRKISICNVCFILSIQVQILLPQVRPNPSRLMLKR